MDLNMYWYAERLSRERITELEEERRTLRYQQEKLYVSPERAREALELHLKQLERLGATLEDSICEILRNIIEAGELQREIESKTRSIESINSELNYR